MKVIDTTTNDSEISSIIDVIEGRDLPDQVVERINQEVGDYILEQTLLYVSDAKSPISGEAWKKSLNPEYRKEKEDEGGVGIANLELKGDMLQALEVKATDGGIKIGVFGDEALKADGHNNFSGDSSLPQRRFLPGLDQEYKGEIGRGISEIINDILSESTIAVASDFETVETKSDLYNVLEGITGISGREAIGRAVLGNANLTDLLDSLGLLDLL